MAWLAATPKPPEGTKRASAKDQDKRSRLERMKADKIEPTMPPNPMPHLISRLIEIGITEAGGMGPVPLSWREIVAWQEATRVRLAAWEARLMRQLSLTYISESRRAEDETCPAPYRMEITQRERDADEARLRLVLG